MKAILQFFREKTRNRQFLVGSALAIAALGLVVAGSVELYSTKKARSADDELRGDQVLIGPPGAPQALVWKLPDAPMDELLDLLRVLVSGPEDPRLPAIEQAVTATTTRTKDERAVLLAAVRGIRGGRPTAPLLTLTREGVRFAEHAAGVVWEHGDEPQEAAAAYEREGRFAEAKLSRRRALELFIWLESKDDLARLEPDPKYQGILAPYHQLERLVLLRDWGRVFLAVGPAEWQSIGGVFSLLAGFTGLLWFIFLMHAARSAPLSWRSLLLSLGLVAGCSSIWPTVFFILFQDDGLGLTEPAEDVVGGIFYFVAGVGFREELGKLLLFLPFLPILLRRKSDLEALVVASSVGLGFATIENINYFAISLADAAPARFLTANFFHAAATGLIGLCLYRACRRRAPGEALNMFFLVVVAHGLYDAFIAVPGLAQDWSLLSFIIFILLSYQFFHELRVLRPSVGGTEAIALSATFLWSVAAVFAVVLVFLTTVVGLREAADRLVTPTLELGVIVYMFLREMPGTLVRT